MYHVYLTNPDCSDRVYLLENGVKKVFDGYQVVLAVVEHQKLESVGITLHIEDINN